MATELLTTERDTDRDAMVVRHLPLARRLARRYARNPAMAEDLLQVAALGLIRAVDRFDPDRGVSFSSFAVPTILGEIKRHFRDTRWAVHLPRELQERAQRVMNANRELGAELGRPPSAGELAARLQLTLEQVVDALQAATARDAASLDRPRTAGDDADGTFGDTMGCVDPGFERVEKRVTAQSLMGRLDDREREILRLRFHEDLTQSEIGERVGCSQMHVSRLVRGALAKLSAAAGV
jgi:RNA polymerase sigma-B factor